MALAGTLRDFSLADILQLISLQRKTGVLTLKSTQDTVTILFEVGCIVGIDSEVRRLEDRLGNVLLKSGKIDASALERVLRMQRETGQRLGSLLLQQSLITREDLTRALHLQVTQILYRLFRWLDGEYHFTPTSKVDYDRTFFARVPVDDLLLEGMRVLDEWPMIEKQVRSFDAVYVPADPARSALALAAGQGSENGADVAAPAPGAGATALLPVAAPEQRVYGLLDGHRTVQDVIDGSDLGEFETCKSLYHLLQAELIREVRRPAPPRPVMPSPGLSSRSDGLLATGLSVALGALVAASVWTRSDHPIALSLLPLPLMEVGDTLRLSASRSRVVRLEYAVRLYAMANGRYPQDLLELRTRGLIAERDLLDPWGRPYAYLRSRRSYQIRGLDGEEREVPELIVTGQLEEDAPGEPPAPRGSP